jgi:hypothetical protein
MKYCFARQCTYLQKLNGSAGSFILNANLGAEMAENTFCSNIHDTKIPIR